MLRIQHDGAFQCIVDSVAGDAPPVAEGDGRPPWTRGYWVSRIINLNSINANEVTHNGRFSVINAGAVHAVGCSGSHRLTIMLRLPMDPKGDPE